LTKTAHIPVGILAGPHLFAEATKLEDGICLFCIGWLRNIHSEIPVHEMVVLCRNVLLCWNDLGAVSSGVAGISRTEKATGVLACGKQHAVSSRARRAVCDAVLKRMHIYSGTQSSGYGLPGSSVDYLPDREILPRGILPMKQGGGNPGFIGDL